MVRPSLILLVSLSLLPALASASVAQRALSLQRGQTVTEDLDQAVRLHVDRPNVVSAEQLPSLGIRLEAKGPGVAHVFLHGAAGVVAWRVHVDGAPDAEARRRAVDRAREACPGLQANGGRIEVAVRTASCHEAVVELGAHLRADELVIRFDPEGLRAQLGAQIRALELALPELASSVSLAYLGASLRISGRLPDIDSRNEALRVLWAASAGRLLLDLGRLEIGEESR